MELLGGFHLRLNGKAAIQWGADKMSINNVSRGSWCWGAVNYILPLQLPKRSQLSFSASLSAKLTIPQPFLDAHGLFLPSDVPVWKWDCVPCWDFCLTTQRDSCSFSEENRFFYVGHAMKPPPTWQWNYPRLAQVKSMCSIYLFKPKHWHTGTKWTTLQLALITRQVSFLRVCIIRDTFIQISANEQR